jgi:hypothetical protein
LVPIASSPLIGTTHHRDKTNKKGSNDFHHGMMRVETFQKGIMGIMRIETFSRIIN